MYIINPDLYDKLPEEAKEMISSEGMSVEDEAKIEQIEKLAGPSEEAEAPVEEMEYGEDGEYKDAIEEDGGFEMPESKKNSIKSFEDAADRGNSLIVALEAKGPKQKGKMGKMQHKLGKIPTEKTENDVE